MIRKEHDYFVDNKYGQTFSRISGGLAWPVARKQGVIVIVGESRSVPHGKKPKYFILAERKDFNVTALVRAAYSLGRRYCVDRWTGDTTNEPMRRMMLRTKIILTITNPAVKMEGPEALGAYVAQIRELADARNKRLYFGTSRLGAALRDIRLTDVRNTTRVADFPEVAALGGLLTSLESYPHDPHETERVYQITEAVLSEMNDTIDGE